MTEEITRQPTIAEMRRVARYMSETMQLHGAAGKLLAKADQLERVVKQLMEVKRDEIDRDG